MNSAAAAGCITDWCRVDSAACRATCGHRPPLLRVYIFGFTAILCRFLFKASATRNHADSEYSWTSGGILQELNQRSRAVEMKDPKPICLNTTLSVYMGAYIYYWEVGRVIIDEWKTPNPPSPPTPAN